MGKSRIDDALLISKKKTLITTNFHHTLNTEHEGHSIEFPILSNIYRRLDRMSLKEKKNLAKTLSKEFRKRYFSLNFFLMLFFREKMWTSFFWESIEYVKSESRIADFNFFVFLGDTLFWWHFLVLTVGTIGIFTPWLFSEYDANETLWEIFFTHFYWFCTLVVCWLIFIWFKVR